MTLTSSQAPTSVLRVAGVYLAVGVIWILLSDRLLAYLVSDPATISTLQTLKGWIFVAASAALIAWLVRREVRRLARTQSRFEALAGQGIVGTFAIQNGRLIHANHRLAEIFGYSRDEILGMSPLALVAPADHAKVRDPGLDKERGGLENVELVHRRFTGVRKDGTTVQTEVHGRLTDWDGSVAMAGVLLDISDHLRLQDRLRHAGRMEALGEVTGAVAHDFNNFLTGILGNLDLVLADIADDPVAAEESLQMVRDAASRAANLTGQLLSFSRGRTFQHKPIDANAHLAKLAPFLRSICEGNQELLLELQEELPFILLDPVALDQLVVNLFVNAKQAMPSGGNITIRTRSRASSAGSDVFLEVQDEGVGMESDVLSHVFEPFFTTKERGTGLGLATVRNIMDEARGHLVVDSAPGKGTTVRLLFPEAAHFLSREAPAPEAVHPGFSTRTARIVVLDGSPGVGGLMCVALRRVGHQTLEAKDAGEVLALLDAEGGSVDLVILDAASRDVAQGALLDAIRKNHGSTPILATTTSRSEDDLPEGMKGLPVLTKPFSVDRLLDAVAAAMRPDLETGGPRSYEAGGP